MTKSSYWFFVTLLVAMIAIDGVMLFTSRVNPAFLVGNLWGVLEALGALVFVCILDKTKGV